MNIDLERLLDLLDKLNSKQLRYLEREIPKLIDSVNVREKSYESSCKWVLLAKRNDGQVFKVNEICMCSECQKRKMPELFLEDLNGNYADCIKVGDLFTGEYQLNNDLDELQQNE